MTSKTTIEMTATIIEYARLKQVHICEDFPLMRAEEKAKKYEKIDKITKHLTTTTIATVFTIKSVFINHLTKALLFLRRQGTRPFWHRVKSTAVALLHRPYSTLRCRGKWEAKRRIPPVKLQ